MSSRLKILYVSSVRFFSGAEVLLADYLRGNLDIEPLLAAPDSPLLRQATEVGVRTYRVRSLGELHRSRKPWWPLAFIVRATGAFFRLMGLILRRRPHIVHANNFAAALYAILPAKLTRRPFVWHIYDIFPPGSIENRIIKSLSAKAAAIVVPSEACATNLMSLGININDVYVVHNGVDCHGRFDPGRYESGRIRDALDIAGETLIVSMCGQLVEWKGLHVLLDAIELLQEHPDNVRYALVGSAPKKSADYLAAQQRRVRQSELLADRVVFLGWQQDMPEVIRDLDVVVAPSLLPDPLPTIVIESMSLGKPVIGSQTGGIPEMIEDGVSGFLIEPGNAAQLADRIHWMATHRDQVRDMGRRSRLKVTTDFSLDRYRQEILQIYRDASRSNTA